MPFSFRKAISGNPFLREIVIPFGASGYVALYEIENEETVTILAVRHQREDDYHSEWENPEERGKPGTDHGFCRLLLRTDRLKAEGPDGVVVRASRGKLGAQACRPLPLQRGHFQERSFRSWRYGWCRSLLVRVVR